MAKNKFILIVLILSLIFVACNKEEVNIEELYPEDSSKNITMTIEVRT